MPPMPLIPDIPPMPDIPDMPPIPDIPPMPDMPPMPDIPCCWATAGSASVSTRAEVPINAFKVDFIATLLIDTCAPVLEGRRGSVDDGLPQSTCTVQRREFLLFSMMKQRQLLRRRCFRRRLARTGVAGLAGTGLAATGPRATNGGGSIARVRAAAPRDHCVHVGWAFGPTASRLVHTQPLMSAGWASASRIASPKTAASAPPKN